MIRIILESNNNNDVLLIKEIAERLRIKYEIHNISQTGNEEKQKLEHYYNIINKGVDVSNYGDPSIWQKKVREDRNINFS